MGSRTGERGYHVAIIQERRRARLLFQLADAGPMNCKALEEALQCSYASVQDDLACLIDLELVQAFGRTRLMYACTPAGLIAAPEAMPEPITPAAKPAKPPVPRPFAGKVAEILRTGVCLSAAELAGRLGATRDVVNSQLSRLNHAGLVAGVDVRHGSGPAVRTWKWVGERGASRHAQCVQEASDAA